MSSKRPINKLFYVLVLVTISSLMLLLYASHKLSLLSSQYLEQSVENQHSTRAILKINLIMQRAHARSLLAVNRNDPATFQGAVDLMLAAEGFMKGYKFFQDANMVHQAAEIEEITAEMERINRDFAAIGKPFPEDAIILLADKISHIYVEFSDREVDNWVALSKSNAELESRIDRQHRYNKLLLGLVLFVCGVLLWLLFNKERTEAALQNEKEKLEIRVKARTAELLESKEHFRGIASNLPGVVYQFYARPGGEYGFYYVSERSMEVLGLSPECDGFFERFAERVLPEFQKSFFESIAAVVKNREKWGFEGAFRKPTGEKVWFKGLSRPTRKGDELVFDGVLLDITEQKRAEEALRFSENKFSLAFQSSPNAITLVDLESLRRVEVNDAHFYITGYSREEVLGKTLDEIQIFVDPEKCKFELGKLAQTGSVKNIELELKTKNNEIRQMSYSAVIFELDGKKFALVTGEDFTERKKASEALLKSEEKFRTLFDTANDAIFTIHQNVFVDCNSRTLEMFGCTREQIIGQTPYDFSPELQPDGRNSGEKAIEKVKLALGGTPQFFEWRHCKYDGTPFDTEVSLNRIELSEGIFLQAMVRDVSARKMAEEELRQKEEQQALILRALPMVFYVAQPFGSYGGTWVSEQIRDITGFSPERFIEDVSLWSDRLHSADRDRVISEFDKIVDAGSISIEYRWLAADGSCRWFHDEAVLVRDDTGRPKEIVGSWLDITERRTEQQTLRLTKHTVDQSPLPIVWLLGGEKVVYANDSACTLLGYTLPEILSAGTNLFNANGTNKYKEQCLSLVKEKTSFTLEIDLCKKDGTVFPALATPSYLTYEGKEYVIIPFLDLTEKKKMEEDLQQAHKMDAIGTLAGGIAHDFNNILSAIFGYSDLALIEIDKREALLVDIEGIRTAAERARQLVRQILTFSRSGKEKLRPLCISLVVKEALKLLRSSMPTTIEIIQDITSEEFVLADPTQIHQVVMNLCTNAYHAMRETGGILRVVINDLEIAGIEVDGVDLPPGKCVHLEISDTGIGMDAETKEKIFEPYFTTKEVGDGTGLGLSVVHGIVKSHNGWLKVDSQPERGTSFHIYFPVVEEPKEERLEIEQEDHFSGGDEKIMVVDDEKAIVALQQKILTRYGYTVYTYTNGVQALQDFQQQPANYDLIITDMTMPYMTGTQLAQKIMEIRPDMQIILCTGHSDLTDREKARSMGIKEYCEKPIRTNNFLGTIRRVLGEVKKDE